MTVTKKSLEEQYKEHDEAHIHGNDGWTGKWSAYLPEFVYGGIDGIVTTFAVVAGATGANLDISIVLILGFANLFADGFSMAVGSYLSTKSEHEEYEKNKRIEYEEIALWPDVEKDEIRNIYREKGFEGELLEQVVEVIVSDEKRRVDVMMKEELGMVEPDSNPLINGGMTLLSFIVVGLFPLLAYVFYYRGWIGIDNLFTLSIIVTSVAFVGIGWLKSALTKSPLLRSIFETLLLGLLAALVAYYIGDLLEKIIL